MKCSFSIICVINTEELKEEYSTFLLKVLQRNDTEVFLYDTICTQETTLFIETLKNEIAQDPNLAEKENLIFKEKKDWNIWQCYNEAMTECQGQYINFSKITGHFQTSHLGKIKKAFDKYAVPAVTLVPFQIMGGKRTCRLFYNDRDCAFDLSRKPFHMNLCLETYFLEKEIFQKYCFDEKPVSETAEFTLLKFLEEVKRYAVIKGAYEIDEYLIFDAYNYFNTFYKEWYTKEVKETYLPFLIDNASSIIRQSWILQQIMIKLNANINDRNKAVLTADERDEFFNTISEVFSYIDDDVLVQFKWNHKRMMGRYMSANFLRMKYKQPCLPMHIEYEEDDNPETRVAVYGDTVVDSLKRAVLNIKTINWENRSLCIDGALANMYYADYDQLKLYVCMGDEKIPAIRTELYSYTKFFAKPVEKGYMFRVEIPEEKFKDVDTGFYFEIEYLGELIRPKHVGKDIHSKLDYSGWTRYWRFDNYILRFSPGRQEYILERATLVRKIKRELRYEYSLWQRYRNKKVNVQEKAILKEALILRMLYFVTKPIYGKRNIWISFDQLFKGGDNGEYFYRYMRENHKEIDMYYIINEDTVEYRELQPKYGNLLKFGSRKTKLMSLHAKMIFDTRANVKLYCGFTEKDERYVRDLFNAEVVCLQHGLTIQKIAQYQNRIFDNLKYYYCVSPYEVENIKKPIYGYTDEMISLTGAPRYDGLKGEPLKQILITPTWRRNVTEGTNQKGKNHSYSVNFRNTVYYKIYNTLINDKRLIECAKETGYKIIYLIHPILSPQIDDFETNEFVEIRPGADVNYEKILKESSLMVTDYSGIQFDFAYMRRPLVYYHPDELPPQYEEGNLKYDTMGFGPVCKNNEQIVDELCKYMRNQCQLEPVYKERIEDFFPYNDQNNCQRVYEASIEFQNKLLKQKK